MSRMQAEMMPATPDVTAATLRRALIAGAQRVMASRDELNRINVFPVPDGDTGSNLAATLGNVLQGALSRRSQHIGELLAGIGNDAIDGARGNSGAIMAQFLYRPGRARAQCAACWMPARWPLPCAGVPMARVRRWPIRSKAPSSPSSAPSPMRWMKPRTSNPTARGAGSSMRCSARASRWRRHRSKWPCCRRRAWWMPARGFRRLAGRHRRIRRRRTACGPRPGRRGPRRERCRRAAGARARRHRSFAPLLHRMPVAG